ncbi:MAG: YjbQ family protein [Deltaproteobacteria bacterium]|jgi:secondary thiamine-phosphate synthase enzyme|nr:YjbQ family protein [Deltaproteobacteria bacterium]MBW2475850.1 YjbQ family protein [Deltaproteobacteria bacterium]MBW2503951.1 YjbQ family protein [Deltaproteobacteria bacterium]MBW2520710.1 YjbQ family protein [Deltaproteobacteria bacterium]
MISFTISTHYSTEMIDITQKVLDVIRKGDIQNGLALVFTPHTTAAITINENADPSVTSDMLMEINKIVPDDDSYQHLEGNSAAHIKSSLFGPGEVLIISKGHAVLGVWQGVYFCEFDGPRLRQVQIQLIGK